MAHAADWQDGALPPDMPQDVAAVFAGYPAEVRPRLLALRALILETAAATPVAGPLTETLKWGEPAYLTAANGAGSTLRIGCKPARPERGALLFHCRTTLVADFRQLPGGTLSFEGGHAVLVPRDGGLPEAELRRCIAMALTYHLDRRRGGRRNRRRAGERGGLPGGPSA
ncbi:DUF1801 domain-containing protein [Marinibaculum pumilum]|uniref:DUF1801 domain-containing protein n=1 Tax=Marinibaculum pumilum TaxID=1766165 RepID=A0ABV7L0A0_9PROT